MKKVEISEALETRIISKFLEISKKTNFTLEEALEEILDYLDQVEYELEVTEEELASYLAPTLWR
jgi:hypothetical protein